MKEAMFVLPVLTLLSLMMKGCLSVYQDPYRDKVSQITRHGLDLDLLHALVDRTMGKSRFNARVSSGNSFVKSGPSDTVWSEMSGSRPVKREYRSGQSLDKMMAEIEAAFTYLENEPGQNAVYPDKRLRRPQGRRRQHNFVRIGKRRENDGSIANGGFWDGGVGDTPTESSNDGGSDIYRNEIGLGVPRVWSVKNGEEFPDIDTDLAAAFLMDQKAEKLRAAHPADDQALSKSENSGKGTYLTNGYQNTNGDDDDDINNSNDNLVDDALNGETKAKRRHRFVRFGRWSGMGNDPQMALNNLDQSLDSPPETNQIHSANSERVSPLKRYHKFVRFGRSAAESNAPAEDVKLLPKSPELPTHSVSSLSSSRGVYSSQQGSSERSNNRSSDERTSPTTLH